MPGSHWVRHAGVSSLCIWRCVATTDASRTRCLRTRHWTLRLFWDAPRDTLGVKRARGGLQRCTNDDPQRDAFCLFGSTISSFVELKYPWGSVWPCGEAPGSAGGRGEFGCVRSTGIGSSSHLPPTPTNHRFGCQIFEVPRRSQVGKPGLNLFLKVGCSAPLPRPQGFWKAIQGWTQQ